MDLPAVCYCLHQCVSSFGSLFFALVTLKLFDLGHTVSSAKVMMRMPTNETTTPQGETAGQLSSLFTC